MTTNQPLSMAELKSLLSCDPRDPIVYDLPGHDNDVRLEVLGQVFLVHSDLLKTHSAFFRTFLKTDQVQATGTQSMYDYVTQIDQDGRSWALVPASSSVIILSTPILPQLPLSMVLSWRECHSLIDLIQHQSSTDANKTLPIELTIENRIAFCRLLQAIYGRRYELDTVKDLELLIEIADYYCALPVLSRTTTQNLVDNRNFLDALHEESLAVVKMLILATKIRHADLFRDCLRFACADWQQPIFLLKKELLDDYPDILEAAQLAYNDIGRRVGEVFTDITEWEPTATEEEAERVADAKKSLLEGWNHAMYFQEVRDIAGVLLSSEVVEELLATQFCFNYDSKQNDVEIGFHCARIADKHLPWDTTQLDW